MNFAKCFEKFLGRGVSDSKKGGFWGGMSDGNVLRFTLEDFKQVELLIELSKSDHRCYISWMLNVPSVVATLVDVSLDVAAAEVGNSVLASARPFVALT